ncbi:uncharacterized protein MONBRDRAFT_25732 [Monosiga brevicollis MX1]|uniref:Glycoside hydrolase family 38 N-terminal domain-containing protein n=1 Tax=Monosiga brevicollis TaxID=81824 RepID=A9V096_MONBE|nr:uncharacterized protein MONBRDRAFT_25732 [Monosiga brevicollis MX1]EDQ89119.1 predicted protein [Monosiga brevicollis MX1]|eukprot:XP_001746224.1 hypothetical protein [Monosiga brevicollis MX1]
MMWRIGLRWLCWAAALLGLLVSARDVSHVTHVHVVQTCHLDVGFADTAAHELDNYKKYLLEAKTTAEWFQQHPPGHGEGLVFTTHPYIVSLLLDCPPGMGFTCPTPTEQDQIRAALRNGDVVMQAFPHNSETATFSSAFFEEALQLGKRLSVQLNISSPLVMTQRDVPGATRGMIPLLARNDSRTEVLATVHPYGYGGITLEDCIVLDGLSHALCPDYNNDNAGPWSVDQIQDHWASLRSEFTNATVLPSSFDAFFRLLDPIRAQLPIVEDEIGDTWIYGVPSDPVKNTQYREMLRAWEDCQSHGQCNASDPILLNFTRLLLKNPEHTWGGDVKNVLGDVTNWDNTAFYPLQYNASNFLAIAATWNEQRDWGLTYPMQALGGHPLANDIRQRLQELEPRSPGLSGYQKISDPTAMLTYESLRLQFNAAGGLVQLEHGGTSFASTQDVVALFEYQSHTPDEYDKFFNHYFELIEGQIPSYAPKDFGKPGLNTSQYGNWKQTAHAQLVAAFERQKDGVTDLQLELVMNTNLTKHYGAPATVWLHYQWATANPSQLQLTVTILNKPATRLPESLWLRFDPSTDLSNTNYGWSMDKLNTTLHPLDVAINGSTVLHAVSGSVHYTGNDRRLSVTALDAPVIAWGHPTPFPACCDALPDLNQGFSSCLYNNIWGTNYIMWFPYRPEETGFISRYQIRLG